MQSFITNLFGPALQMSKEIAPPLSSTLHFSNTTVSSFNAPSELSEPDIADPFPISRDIFLNIEIPHTSVWTSPSISRKL
jgi:hypothetical protein